MKKLFILIVLGALVSSCTFYEYDSEFDRRDRVVGQYEVEEYSETWDGFTSYSISIAKGSYLDEIIIYNFYGSGLRVFATLNGERITIPYQVVNGYEIEGFGVIYGNEMDLTYSVTDLYDVTPTDFCETVAWLEF